jgi:hypothetical protein
MNTTLFRQFRYPTVPLGVSDEYRNQLLRRKLAERHASLWEDDEA